MLYLSLSYYFCITKLLQLEQLVLAWAGTCGHVVWILIACCNTSICFDRGFVWLICTIVIEWWLRSIDLTYCNYCCAQAIVVTANSAAIPTSVLLLHPYLHHLPQFILLTRLHYDPLMHSLDYLLLQQRILVQFWEMSSWIHFVITSLRKWNYETSSKTAAKEHGHYTNIE